VTANQTGSENEVNAKTTAQALFASLVVAASAAEAQTMIGGGKTSPNFPIVLNQPGSYKLANTLVVPAGTTAIPGRTSQEPVTSPQ
jgi:hypothetical protein